VRVTEEGLADLLRTRRSFLICSHINPDGDALGASVALALFLEGEGKDVFVYNQDPLPPLYGFIPGAERVRQDLPRGRAFDLSLLLDCSSPSRVGAAFEGFPGKGEVVIVDHHPPLAPVEARHLIETSAAATCELLYRVIVAFGGRPTPEVATALYVGLVTDTGSFRFGNTTARSLAVASELLEAGADHRTVMLSLYENYPKERFTLLAKVLETLEFAHDGRVAVLQMTRTMAEEAGGSQDLSEGFVDIPRSIRGVEVSLLFREVDSGEQRVSMRSRGSVDVGRIASRFQGGGHPAAAGCTIRGDRVAAYQAVLAAVREALP
jgi:phosphoesterase RecJ-like protein